MFLKSPQCYLRRGKNIPWGNLSARLQCVCGRTRNACVGLNHPSHSWYYTAAMFVRPTISWVCGTSTSRRCILLHGCNICVISPKIFVWNEKPPSTSSYCMAAMLLRPTNSRWWGMKSSRKYILLHACNVVVVDPKKFVWNEHASQIECTAWLQCYCGQATADGLVWKLQGNACCCIATTFLWLTQRCLCGTKTWLKFMTLHGCNVFAAEMLLW